MNPHWTLDDIDWPAFDPAKLEPHLVEAVKAAAMVEHNADDYVAYLCNVFADDPAMQDAARAWGVEEVQHGRALARWAELADPGFDAARALERFRAGYRLPVDATASVRGSRAGELIARCVVEVGTSSFYSALRDASAEPVLRQVAGRIAADEFRHYKLFYDHMRRYVARERLSLPRRLRIALGRIDEVADDELAYAYFCGNCDEGAAYDRAACADAYGARAFAFYRRQHVARAVSMVAKAVGLHPHGWFARLAGGLSWFALRLRLRRLRHAPA
jgi:hypothetical protein